MKLALVKQDVYQDLYVAASGSAPQEMLASTLMRVGPLGMFTLLGAEKIGNPLDRLATKIPWESFRPVVRGAINSLKETAKAPGGRPAFDPVLMFKITIL